jgi:hypothetical protein
MQTIFQVLRWLPPISISPRLLKSIIQLDLNRSTVLSGPRSNHEVSGWDFVLYYLSDGADCVNDSRPNRVGLELLQRSQGTTAIWIEGEREHVGMIGRESCSIYTNP